MRHREELVTDRCKRMIAKIEAQVLAEKNAVQHGNMKFEDTSWSGLTFNNIHKALNF